MKSLAPLVLAMLVIFSFNLSAMAQYEPVRPVGSPPIYISNPDHWMAIVGDSAATGAVSSPKLKPKLSNLLPKALRVLTIGGDVVPRLKYIPNPEKYNLSSPLERVSRPTYSAADYLDALADNNVAELNRNARAARVIDTPEYSFGYFVGRSLGIKGSDIVMTAQDGQRVDSIAKQFRRIYELYQSTLPPLILISFTANDLCDEGIFGDSTASRP